MGNSVFICDFDGTVSDLKHRLHLIQGEKKYYDQFYAACVDDAPHKDVINVIFALSKFADIVYITGRSETCRSATSEWLYDNGLPLYDNGLPNGALYMRSEKDYRPDTVVKSELMDQFISDYKKDHYGHEPRIEGIFEDRQAVVDMWRKRGYRVYQVQDGKY